jgi:hypothetical protein
MAENIAIGPGQFLLGGVTKMAIMKYLRKWIGKGRPKPTLTYIEDEPAESESVVEKSLPPMERSLREMDGEIDLSRHADLEDYAKDINVSKESIERWISSGLLMPEELKMAEKLVQLMRNKH